MESDLSPDHLGLGGGARFPGICKVVPRQRSRSPLSPILATESATVRLFFILSVLLCSVNKAGLKTETWLLYCLRLHSRSPHNAKHSTSYWGERERAPSCGLNGRAVMHDIYTVLSTKRVEWVGFQSLGIFSVMVHAIETQNIPT